MALPARAVQGLAAGGQGEVGTARAPWACCCSWEQPGAGLAVLPA